MSKRRYPAAEWQPIPEHGDGTRYTKTQLIFHSTGTRASAEANRRYFAQAGVKVESTFIVDYDGQVLQLLDADEAADANGSANRRAISVEVVGEAGEPFTAEQVNACIGIARWACSNHPIQRRLCPAHDQSGIGWHVQFGAPGPWTSVKGKECPGPKRIAQVRGPILRGAQDPAKPTPAPTPAPTPTPTPAPAQEGYMAAIVTVDGAKMYVADAGTVRHIKDQAELGLLRRAGIVGTKVNTVSQADLDALEQLAAR